MKKIGIVFPGQGSQTIGMGKTLKDQSKFLYANEMLGYSFSEKVFSGSAEWLQNTRNSQLAIFLHSVSLFDSWKSASSLPIDSLAGLSLGEYSALYAAEALSFEDGFRLVQKRAELMEASCKEKEGSMMAVLGLDEHLVNSVVEEIDHLYVANYNTPLQQVLSGSPDSLKKAEPILYAKGAKKVVVLKVSGAFHSPFMQSAQNAYEEFIHSVTIVKPKVPVYMNVSAELVTDVSEIKKNLILQITSPVKWAQTMANMSLDVAIEIGSKTLTAMNRKMKVPTNISIQEESDFSLALQKLGPLHA